MPNPEPGAILGAYRVEGTIGSGSMGEVFRGIDTGLNRRVAIKILSEKHRDSAELRARFVREGRAVAAISHPNVVQVFATGSFDDRPYIAMELLDGTDLGSTVEHHGPLDSLAAAHAILDAAQGLDAAARAGLIHRDVKPSNLVRLVDGKVKVTDFGLAKPVDPGAEPALTAMGVVVGTPDYIAPEQARGEHIDERVDIYALGGSLYFLLTGRPPFRTGKPAEDKYLKVVARHLRNPPPDAMQKNPACDRELAELARAMMAKQPRDRPSYDQLVARLHQIIARLDPSAAPLPVSATRERSRPLEVPADQPPAPHDAASESEDDLVPPRAFPGWLIAVTLASIGLFVVGLVVYLRADRTPVAPEASSPAPAAPGQGSTSTAPTDVAPATASPSPAAGSAAPGSAAAAPTPPAGMLLVTPREGAAFYVDARPLTLATYRAVFAAHQQPGNPDDAVRQVSYTEARSYALTHGARLLTSAEWEAAASTPGFELAPGLLEWVESMDEKQKTVRQRGKTLTRADARHRDVTFRTARTR